MSVTFLTRASFGRTAEDLDKVRLVTCQRVGSDLFDMLTGAKDPGEFRSHPTYLMWNGYEFALGIYVMMLNMESAFKRGYAEAKPFWNAYKGIKEVKALEEGFAYEPPPWFRDQDVMKSHRSNLLRRSPELYKDTWEVCPVNWPYLWPVIDAGQPEGYKLMLSTSDRRRVRARERVLPAEVRERVFNW